MMLEKFTIRSQILISFTVMATIAIVLIGSLSVANISLLGERTQDLSESTLNEQVERNIIHIVEENSLVVERKLDNAISAVTMLANAAENLFSGDFDINDTASYFDYNPLTWPGMVDDPEYGVEISREVSTYYVPGSHPSNISSLITQPMADAINTSAHLDTTFKSIMESFPEFAWLYVGFEVGSVFRVFPGSKVSETRDYDPQQRPWYVNAQANLGNVIITDPYVDAFGQGLMVTIAVSIHDPQDNLIGVVGGDLTLGSIQEKILDISFLKSGYSALIQTSGLVLVHPAFDPETDSLTSISQLEKGKDGGSPIDQDMLTRITNAGTGIDRFTRDGTGYIMAHSRILNRYSLLLIVEEDEALQAIRDLDQEINDSEQSSRTFVTTLSVITLILVLGLGLWIADQISKPMNRLSKTAEKISANITSRDIFQGVNWEGAADQDDEIGELTRSFSKMLDSLRDEKKVKK